MIWQDIVFGGGQWAMAAAQFFTVRHPRNKPAFWTSALTAPVLCSFTITFASLGFWNSAAAALVLTCQWSMLGYQRYRLSGIPYTDFIFELFHRLSFLRIM